MTVKLGYTPTIASDKNLNDAQVDGNYFLSGTYANSPVSGQIDGILYTKRVNLTGQKCIQTIQTYNNPPKMYIRILDISYGGVPYGSPTGSGIWTELLGSNSGFGGNITFAEAAVSNVGESAKPANNVYTQNAVTVVSDRNAKNSIQSIDDKVLDAWSEVKQKQYKLNGDDNWSFGYIAQDIVESFTRHGLDYKQYNIVHEEDGKFMLKYDMCDILESALNRRKLK